MDLEQVIKQSQGERYVYPDIFPDNCGLDIVLPNDKLHAVRSWGYRKNNPRRLSLIHIYLKNITGKITTTLKEMFPVFNFYWKTPRMLVWF